MDKHKLLMKNLFISLIALFLFHSLYFMLAVILYKIAIKIIIQYFILAVLYHALILIILVYLKDYFVLEENGKFLTRINISNIITFIRITSLPVILILLLNISTYPILPVFLPYICVIFITDFLDGYTARRLKETTKIGKYLDSISDYLVLICLSIIFTNYHIIPPWFLLLVLIRLITLALGVIIMSLVENKILYTITFLGKASIFSMMALYALELLNKFLFSNHRFSSILTIVEYGVGAIIVVSFVEKMNIIIRELMSLDGEKHNRE